MGLIFIIRLSDDDVLKFGRTLKKIFVGLFLLIQMSCGTAFGWEYIGHVEAVKSVQIRSEINARIAKIHFKEGSFVKKSTSLFTLNTAQFQAEVSLRKAELSSAQAKLESAAKYLSRLKATDQRGVTASDLDNAESEIKQAKAAVEEAKASLKLAEIQLSYTRITAPFAGRIGKINFHQGSYVSPENVLCEIVQTAPVRILFAMPDRDYLSFRDNQQNFKYELVLADGSSYLGTVEKDFENNVMNTDTGTMNIWLKADNENNILLPGALVRVKVISGE